MATLGDTSNYSALLANMLAQARSRPLASPTNKVLALSSKTPALSTMNTNVSDTNMGVNLGKILDYVKGPTTPEAKLAAAKEKEVELNNVQMAWMHLNTALKPEELNKMQDQPQMQSMLTKAMDIGSPVVWFNPDTNRKEFVPMSDEMKYKLSGAKAPTKEQVLMMPPGTPGRENLIQGTQAIQPKTHLSQIDPELFKKQVEAGILKETAQAGEAGAGADLKRGQVGEIPLKSEKIKAETDLTKETTKYLAGGKGQGAVMDQKEKERIQKATSGVMENFTKQFNSITKEDIRYGEENYNRQLTNLNSAVVGTITQLKGLNATHEIAGVAGQWLTHINKQVSAPRKMSGGKLTPDEKARLTDIRNSIGQVIIAGGMEFPYYQKQQLNNILKDLNSSLGIVTKSEGEE